MVHGFKALYCHKECAYSHYCMTPYKMKLSNCALFSVTHIVCFFFSLENIVPEIVHHIHYNNPVNVPLTFVRYGKKLHAGVALRQIWHSVLPRAILKEGLVMCSALGRQRIEQCQTAIISVSPNCP